MYELSGFNVTRSNNRFKLGDFAVARLNKFTNMVEVPAVANLIPTEIFRTIRGCTAAPMADGERATFYDSVETPVDASNTGEEEID
ncbi:hypothetical protein F2Q70_00039067 [Brassica cretica]|uniref:Uncharacterized protein n=2 Tax=Brassica cretica TaxID=69181 RepID=A0A8S9KBG1_BRACR|nr:hypothetical protein F2Q70_00039067 [Brassica cretica]KAF2617323.1 hypothetical protein F2Q68_00039745 [Brassica cretica]KAF3493452.1 hypothetical protein DY000_02053477 [Brassica cretica]